MRARRGRPVLLHLFIVARVLALVGCPLPYQYRGEGSPNSTSYDPSSPNITAAVTVTYAEQGGSSGTVADGQAHYSELTTTVTLSTATEHAVIYYTDDGSPLTSLTAAKKMQGSSGEITITRGTALVERDIHAVAVGSGMLPSPAVHVAVGVSSFPVLTLSRSSASITEDGGTASFAVNASSASGTDTTVRLVTGGDYEAGDVTGLSASGTQFTVTLPATALSVTIPFTAQPDPGEYDNDTVTLTILPDPVYTVGFPATASVVIQDNMVLLHSVTYDANGAGSGSVPTDPTAYAPGQSVTVLGNTGNLQKAGYAFAGWNTAANGSGAFYSPGQTFAMGTADVTLFAVWVGDIYVNGITGSDNNPGTAASPVRTINKGLGLATVPGLAVYVSPGTYDLAHGEVFPLPLAAGVRLIGDEAAKGAGTVISGSSPSGVYGSAIAAGASSVVAGFTITADPTAGATFDMAMVMTTSGVTLRNNTIVNSYIGIYATTGAANLVIAGNVITGNTSLGLGFIGGGAGSRVENNQITNNSIGVEYDTAGGDMGGGPTGSVGGNILTCNTRNDVWSVGGLTIDARNNLWDHVPLTAGTDGGGVDFYGSGSATINTTGALVSPAACP